MNIDLKLSETKILSTERDKYNDILIRVETTEDHVHCRMCKEKIYKRHGSDRERKLKHLPVFGEQTYIIYSPHRYICDNCQNNPTTTMKASWHSPNGSHTTDYEDHLLMELVNSTIVDVAIKKGETEESVKGVVNRRIKSSIDWSTIKYLGNLGIDEISLKKGYKDFITIITSRFDGKIVLLAVIKGRKKAAIIGFLRTIPKKLRSTIDAVCVDMYEGYINAIKAVFGNKVQIVVDRFHVAKLYRSELDIKEFQNNFVWV